MSTPQDVAENRVIVATLLNAAGLSVPPEEVDRLAQLYRGLRRQLAMIHAADVGNADPSNVFLAAQVAPTPVSAGRGAI